MNVVSDVQCDWLHKIVTVVSTTNVCVRFQAFTVSVREITDVCLITR